MQKDQFVVSSSQCNTEGQEKNGHQLALLVCPRRTRLEMESGERRLLVQTIGLLHQYHASILEVGELRFSLCFFRKYSWYSELPVASDAQPKTLYPGTLR